MGAKKSWASMTAVQSTHTGKQATRILLKYHILNQDLSDFMELMFDKKSSIQRNFNNDLRFNITFLEQLSNEVPTDFQWGPLSVYSWCLTIALYNRMPSPN